MTTISVAWVCGPLYHGEHWSVRMIARHLYLACKTVRKYLLSPRSVPAR
ncbi:MAG: hypothetical protein ABSA70_05315 [Terriglobia bacterium]